MRRSTPIRARQILEYANGSFDIGVFLLRYFNFLQKYGHRPYVVLNQLLIDTNRVFLTKLGLILCIVVSFGTVSRSH